MAHATASSVATDWVDHRATAMGGALRSQVTFVAPLSDTQRDRATATLVALASRVNAWAAIATRHHPSQLTTLNADTRDRVSIGPTLTSLLAWAADAYELTDGLVDAGLLVQRIAAESGEAPLPTPTADRRWVIEAMVRTIGGQQLLVGGSMRRPQGMQIDLDGVGKGWITDRAADLLVRQLDTAVATGVLPAWHSCFVDGDGDIALRHRGTAETLVAIEVPRSNDAAIGQLRLRGEECGVATSGTGVHQWGGRHHLIDPRSGEPSSSGVAQATVVAESARVAEAWAKAIVIGGAAAIRRAEASGVTRIVAVRDDGAVVTAPALGGSDTPFVPQREVHA